MNDRFPSARDHIHKATTFEYAWATPEHTRTYCYRRFLEIYGEVSISKS